MSDINIWKLNKDIHMTKDIWESQEIRKIADDK